MSAYDRGNGQTGMSAYDRDDGQTYLRTTQGTTHMRKEKEREKETERGREREWEREGERWRESECVCEWERVWESVCERYNTREREEGRKDAVNVVSSSSRSGNYNFWAVFGPAWYLKDLMFSTTCLVPQHTERMHTREKTCVRDEYVCLCLSNR